MIDAAFFHTHHNFDPEKIPAPTLTTHIMIATGRAKSYLGAVLFAEIKALADSDPEAEKAVALKCAIAEYTMASILPALATVPGDMGVLMNMKSTTEYGEGETKNASPMDIEVMVKRKEAAAAACLALCIDEAPEQKPTTAKFSGVVPVGVF